MPINVTFHAGRTDAKSNRAFKARSSLQLCTAIAAICLPLTTLAIDLPTGGKPSTRAFILSNAFITAADEPNACAELTPGAADVFLQTLPAEQQKNLAALDKRNALWGAMQNQLGFKWFRMLPRSAVVAPEAKRQGWTILPVDNDPATVSIDDVRAQAGIPENKGAIVFNHTIVAYDSCTDPADFQMLNRGFQPYNGKVAFGMNLDGKSGRDNFIGPNGEKNIDNQLWRVLGCTKHFREFGNSDNVRNVLYSTAAPTLIEVSGIDNPRNDNDVAVTVYASADSLITDSRGYTLANASYTADPQSKFTTHTRGRIVNGVLTTEPADIRLRFKEQIVDTVRELRGARIRATLKEDGSIEGGFFGYYTLDSFYDSIKQMTQVGANNSSLSCPTIYSAIQRYADGYPDPKTGRNTAISAALSFVGASAFVIKPNDKSVAADTH